MSPEFVELFASLGTTGGVTAVLSWILLRQLDRAQQERAEWMEAMRAEAAQTRDSLDSLRDAVVDLRVWLADRG